MGCICCGKVNSGMEFLDHESYLCKRCRRKVDGGSEYGYRDLHTFLGDVTRDTILADDLEDWDI